MQRREFLTTLSALPLLPALLSSNTALGASTTPPPEPHFFLMLFFPNGLDLTHVWDSRPLAFKAAGLRAENFGVEPVPYGNTLVTSAFDPLRTYANRFSIVRGVWMSPDFDGHQQNVNLMLSGNPFGGSFFVPHLNGNTTPLDSITNRGIPYPLNNLSKVAPLSRTTLNTLQERVSRSQALVAGNPLFEALKNRYQAVGLGSSRMALGSQLLYGGLTGQTELHSQLGQLGPDPVTTGGENFAAYVGRLMNLMKLHSTRTAYLSLTAGGQTIDTHDSESTKQTPKTVQKCLDSVVTAFKVLSETPFDSTRSFLDVTTVLVGTEFGRTNRQVGRPIDDTGTDHNPYNNSFLIGGKGIRGGLTIGASDFETVNETLSPARLKIDPQKLNLMGRPFDFASQTVRTDLPPTVNLSDYITSASIVNTLCSLFNVDPSLWRKNGKETVNAPVLTSILA